jgi:hypothetical protein
LEKYREIQRRIMTGIVLMVVALAIWLITFPNVETIYRPAQKTEKTAAQLAEQTRMYDNDVTNFNVATLQKNRLYCDRILNATMKAECVKLVPNYAAVTVKAAPPKYSDSDVDGYNSALATGDASFCSGISDADLMAQCLNLSR